MRASAPISQQRRSACFPALPVSPSRVLYTQTGVRPLPYKPRGAEGAITRRHIIRRHRAARGLYSIVGGKLTTHRALAEDALRKLRDELPRRVASNVTHERPLPGALPPAERDDLLAELRGRFGERQARRFGASTANSQPTSRRSPCARSLRRRSAAATC